MIPYDVMLSNEFQNFIDNINHTIDNLPQYQQMYYNKDELNIISNTKQEQMELNQNLDLHKHILDALKLNIVIQKEIPQFTDKQIRKSPRKFTYEMLLQYPQLLQLKEALILQSYIRMMSVKRRKLVFKTDTKRIDSIYFKRCKYLIDTRRKQQKIPLIDCTTGKRYQNYVSVLGPNKNQELNKQVDTKTLQEYRQIIKEVLKQFDDEFKLNFKEEPNKSEKEVLRSIYNDYKNLKQFCDPEMQQNMQYITYQPVSLSASNSLNYSKAQEFNHEQQRIQIEEQQAQIQQFLVQLNQYCYYSQQMLQRFVPTNIQDLKQLKHQVQKLLQNFKETYDKTVELLSNWRNTNGNLPLGLQSDWNQKIIYIYNQLYQTYRQLKIRCQ